MGPDSVRASRRWVAVLALAMLAAMIAMAVTPRHPLSCSIVTLELPAADPEGQFRDELLRCWSSDKAVPGARFGVQRLRANLLIDSIPFVPAYVTLLCLSSVLLLRGLRTQRAVLAHAVCILPIVAGLYDWLENGLVARAAEDASTGQLCAALLFDVHQASSIKWWLLAAASLQLALLMLARARIATAPAQRRGMLAGAAMAAVAGAVVVFGVAHHGAGLIAALLLLCAAVAVNLCLLLWRGGLVPPGPDIG